MVKDISRAIAVLYNPQHSSGSSPCIKQEALTYLNSIKSSEYGWKHCLDYIDGSSDLQANFFCLQVVEECLKNRFASLSEAEKSNMRQVVWRWIQSNIATGFAGQDSNPFYIRNKLYLILVLLLKLEYPARWPSFFDDFFSLIESHGSNNQLAIETFLQTCILLDDEVGGHYIQKSPTEQERNNVIKDAMRVSVVPRLVSTWHSIFNTYYQQNKDVALLCLKIFGMYVLWIDVALIITPDFLTKLYSSFSDSDMRSAISECLGFMIAKGMRPPEKIQFIQTLDIIRIISCLQIPADDEVFRENFAKLVNTIGIELMKCGLEYDGQTEPANAAEADRERLLIFSLVDGLFPITLSLLSDEYDETCSALFPFLGQYLYLLKRLLKNKGILFCTNQRLHELLQVLALKMKYDGDSNGGFSINRDQEEEEEDALFVKFRKDLKVLMDSIGNLDYSLFSNTISVVVYDIFSKCKDSGTDIGSRVKWVDAELGLYLTFIFIDGKTKGIPSFFESDNVTLTNMGRMLSQAIDSNISSHPHPAVASIYFDVINRFYSFYEKQTQYIPIILQTFLDSRGLFHPVKNVRLRCRYHFLRFVKNLKLGIAPYVEGILSVLQGLLVVNRRHIVKIEDIGSVGDFDSQLFLFEACGYLISLESIPNERKEEMLTIALVPQLRRLEEIMQITNSNAASEVSLEIVAELGDLISCVGSISKGFPDSEKSKSASDPFWTVPFKTTLQGIVIVLSKFNIYPSIRNAARFTFQRMAGCMGPALLEYVPLLVSSGMLSSETAAELVEFIPFIGLAIHKFQASSKYLLVKMWKPLREKINYFLMQHPNGTDEALVLLNLRKADMSLLCNLFQGGFQDVLTDQENIGDLNGTLMSLLSCFDDLSDSAAYKIGFSLFAKICYCWGGSSPDVGVTTQQGDKSGKGRKDATRSPLQGFDSFILDQIVPVTFLVPLKASFNISDGQSVLVCCEIANVHQQIYQVLGERYLEYMSNIFLPSINCHETQRFQFVELVREQDKKVTKKLIMQFFSNLKT